MHQAGGLVDQVGADIGADQLLVRYPHVLETGFDQLARRPRRDLVAGLGHHLAGVGVDKVTDQLAAAQALGVERRAPRTEEHTSELQSLMRNSNAVFCSNKKTIDNKLQRKERPPWTII